MAATVFNRAVSQYVGDADSAGSMFIRDVSRFPELLKRTDYPLTKTIKFGAPLAQPKLKLEWGIRDIPPVNDTTAAGFDASTTTITPDNIGYYQVNHVILTPAGEKLWVTAVGASTLTVVRASFGGTTGTIVAAGAGLRIIGIATKENADSPLGPITQGEIDFNYFQIFDKMLQFSNRAKNTPTYENSNREQAALRMVLEIEMPRYIEETLLWGTRSLGSTTSPSTTGGVFQTSFNSNVVNAAGDILTEYSFLNGLQLAYNQVGAMNVGKTLMCNPFYKRIFGTWNRDMRRITGTDNTMDNRVQKFDTDFGTVDVLMNQYMVSVTDPSLPDGRMLVFNPDDYTLRPYSADSKWAEYAVSVSGWYDRRAVRGDYGLEAINPERRVAFTNLSTAPIDYPGFIAP
jgi:hypothetical protein